MTIFSDEGVPLWAPAGDRSLAPGAAPAALRSCRVLTIGTFDILHFGHVAFLIQCARLGTELLAGVNTDAFAGKFKAAPVMSEEERVHSLRQLGYRTLLNDGPGRDLIEQAGPDVLAIGSDWARKDYLAQVDVDQDWLDERKIILAYVPYVQAMPISTTEIRRRVRERA
jgi:cytidyltransferase-like protein